MEVEMAGLIESAGLFEVNLPDFKQIKQCRKEILLLKQLWDFIFIVRTSFSDWMTTLWKDINVDQMDMDCKKFAKDIRLVFDNSSICFGLVLVILLDDFESKKRKKREF